MKSEYEIRVPFLRPIGTGFEYIIKNITVTKPGYSLKLAGKVKTVIRNLGDKNTDVFFNENVVRLLIFGFDFLSGEINKSVRALFKSTFD